MRFQIAFEIQGFVFMSKGAIKFDLPGSEFGRLRAAALVVRQEPLLEVPSETDVRLIRVTFTPENVDIEWPLLRFASLSFAGHASLDPCTLCASFNPHLLQARPATRSPPGAKRGGGGGS